MYIHAGRENSIICDLTVSVSCSGASSVGPVNVTSVGLPSDIKIIRGITWKDDKTLARPFINGK
jgi:hypothetical protein